MGKTFSFGIMHISIAFLVVWAMTGDWRIGGATALVDHPGHGHELDAQAAHAGRMGDGLE